MIIEKPGNDDLYAENKYRETYKPKRFKCDTCECEFTATKGEYRKKWFNLGELFDKYKVTCPHCATKLVAYEIPESHIDELLDQLMERLDSLDNGTPEEEQEEEVVCVPTAIKQIQKAGDNAVQVQVAGMITKSPDTIFHEVLEEVKDKLGLNDVVAAQDITSEKPMKALFQKGDRVATVSKGLDDLIEGNGPKITSPVYADGKIVYDPQEPIDFDVVSNTPSWMHQDFRSGNYGIDLTFQELRKMHEQEEKEKEKCR